MTAGELSATYGQIAYEAYVEDCGGVSIHGETLPAWEGQDPVIQEHWEAAGQAVHTAAAL